MGFEYESRATEYQGNILTVTKASVPGLSVEQHRRYRENLKTYVPQLNDKLSVVELPDLDGHKCMIH